MLTALSLYFFPHHKNNYRAKLLRPLIIAVTILVFAVAQFGLAFLPRFTPVVLGYVANITPEQVVELTNNERIKAGLTELHADPQLTEAALNKATYMFAKNYWAHTAPDGTEPWKFVLEAGYKYRFAGENLARDFATPEDAVAAWMNSPTHKDNLLSAKYQDTGIAVVKGELNGVQTTLIVQMFGTKMSAAAAVEESNKNLQAQAKVEEKPQFQIAGLTEEAKGVVSPFSLNKNLGIILISVFLFILVVDMIIINRNKVARSSSKSFAHFFFFGMVAIAIIISKAGNII